VTIYYAANGQGYIIASSQGNGTFKVYERQEASPGVHNFVGTFTVSGVMNTDGIAVLNLPLPLNGSSSQGLFALHNGRVSPYPVELVKWENIAGALGLSIDTDSWDPRVVDTSNNTPPEATDDTDAASDDAFDSLATISITIDPATVLLTTAGFESGNYSGDTGGRILDLDEGTATENPGPLTQQAWQQFIARTDVQDNWIDYNIPL
jgi:hypothetical protein